MNVSEITKRLYATGDTDMQEGDKVFINGTQIVEIVKIFKNRKAKVSFWVQTSGMIQPELWTETVRIARLTAR